MDYGCFIGFVVQLLAIAKEKQRTKCHNLHNVLNYNEMMKDLLPLHVHDITLFHNFVCSWYE